MATTIVSMAARSSNLEDQMSGANLQMEAMQMCHPKSKGP